MYAKRKRLRNAHKERQFAMKNKMKNTVSIRITDDMNKRINTLIKKTGYKKSDIIREIFEKGLCRVEQSSMSEDISTKVEHLWN